MNEAKVLYEEDLINNTTVSRYMEIIKQERESIYQYLRQYFSKDHTLGVRADVLAYMSDHIKDFTEDRDYAYHITSLAGNVKAGPEWYEWINSYYGAENSRIDIGDLMIVVSGAIENNVPLEFVKSAFETENDILEIYEKIDSFHADSIPASPEVSDIDSAESVTDDTDEKSGSDTFVVPEEKKEISEKGYGSKHEPQISDMFESLAMVMSAKTSSEKTVSQLQDDFNDTLSKLQTITTGVFREWEKDKDIIERQKALHQIYQQLINSQQNKINGMRNEIRRLQNRIQDAERSEMKREAINQKISELQQLTHSAGLSVADSYLD